VRTSPESDKTNTEEEEMKGRGEKEISRKVGKKRGGYRKFFPPGSRTNCFHKESTLLAKGG